ncbi:uncharacterized protein ISCGN_020749 [Ixodes scapularis]
MNRADGSRHADEHGTSDSVVDQASPENTALATLQVRLPPFWEKNPRSWFAQVEAQFHLRRVSTQLSKYDYVVSALPPDIADELDDVLATTPPADAYDQLKAAILLRKSESTTSRLQRLLTTEELGDQRPSQILHRMRQLLGEQSSDVNKLHLTGAVLATATARRMVLAPANDMSLDRLAEMADRVAEYAAPTLAALTEPQSSATAIHELQAKVDQLAVTVASLQKHAGGKLITCTGDAPAGSLGFVVLHRKAPRLKRGERPRFIDEYLRRSPTPEVPPRRGFRSLSPLRQASRLHRSRQKSLSLLPRRRI